MARVTSTPTQALLAFEGQSPDATDPVEARAVQKRRGGYYTPPAVASWLAGWAVRSAMDRVLEPSCGDGAFIGAVAARLASLRGFAAGQLVGVELIDDEAKAAREKASALLDAGRFEVHAQDFFRWYGSAQEGTFDAVVGNPPFIRYQQFPESSRTLAMRLMQSKGLVPNRLTNMWVPFVVASVAMLREGGRLAMVVPAELLQVTYAGQLRRYLVDSFKRVSIYACNEVFFDGAQQEVVLLLGDGRLAEPDEANECVVSLRETASVKELLRLSPSAVRRERPKVVKHDTEKWLKFFLAADEIAFMRDLRTNEKVASLDAHGEVDVGVVTGNNDFFVLTKNQVRDLGVENVVAPLVSRSSHLAGTVLRETELRDLADSGERVFLLNYDLAIEAAVAGLRKHIEAGEQRKVHEGYKCSIRNPWYAVPGIWEPDGFLFRQIYDFPRMVVNKARATSTDTIHRFTCKAPATRVAANLFTHLTAASAEIEGRSYGGGVLELEPTEAERLLVPKELNGAMPIEDADRLVREGKLATVLDHNDKAVLQETIGLSKKDCGLLKRVWNKMRERRKHRARR